MSIQYCTTQVSAQQKKVKCRVKKIQLQAYWVIFIVRARFFSSECQYQCASLFTYKSCPEQPGGSCFSPAVPHSLTAACSAPSPGVPPHHSASWCSPCAASPPPPFHLEPAHKMGKYDCLKFSWGEYQSFSTLERYLRYKYVWKKKNNSDWMLWIALHLPVINY